MEEIDFERVNPKALEYIEKYVTNNIDALTSDSYVKKLVFGGERKYDLLDIYEFDERSWNRFMRGNNYLTISTENKDPLNSLLLYSYYTHREVDEEEARKFLIFLMIKLYTSKYHRSFKYGVVEERMEYTIENLSGRYDIRRYGSLLEVFQNKLETMFNNYGKEFKRMDDEDVYDNGLLTHFSTRIGHMVNSVAEKYYENEKVMWKDEEIRDRDGRRTTTNMSLEFERVENLVTTKIIKYGLDGNILREINGMQDRRDFQNMFNNDSKKVTALTSIVINDYIKKTDSPSIDRAKRYGFVEYLKKSRKKDERIKEIINELAEEYSTRNKAEFKKTLKRYIGVLIHRELQKL